MTGLRVELVIGILGIVVGIAGVGVNIFFGQRETPDKQVEWHIDTYTNLFGIADSTPGAEKIQILFDGQPVETIEFVQMTFVNTGGLPVDTSDYREPLSLDFGDSAQIYSYGAIVTDSSRLNVEMRLEPPARLILDDTLLTPGESFSIQILGADFDSVPSVGGRVVGITQIPVILYPSLQNTISRFSTTLNLMLATLILGVVVFSVFALVIAGRQVKRFRDPMEQMK
jgi:hypothetical protein